MSTRGAKNFALFIGLLASTAPSLWASDSASFLQTIHHRRSLTSTIPDDGDLNPYAVVVAPVSAGRIQKDDVLISNFNGLTNLQGTGTTVVDYNPSTKRLTTFAHVPQHLTQCPGGVGLSTAMTMLKSGWLIVGSAPSADGTTRTLGAGCLLVFDSNGQLATAWASDNIRCPWGNMAVIDNGTSAILFISMAGFDVPPLQVHDPVTGYPVTVNKGTILRINLSTPEGKPPTIIAETVIANSFGQRADRDVFLIGPTGLAMGVDGTTLYASDALGNQIVAIANATTRTDSPGIGRTVSKDGLLRRPLAMTTAPNGNLLILNAKNGQVVEINPITGEQSGAQWIDSNPAQSPPGNGDLFGIAMKPDGRGFYYVQDEVNTLMEATQ